VILVKNMMKNIETEKFQEKKQTYNSGKTLKSKGGIGMFVIAWIYYIGVRLFGKSHYYWDE